MPERNERLFWMYTKPVDGSMAASIDVVNQQFVKTWSTCGLSCVSCVTDKSLSDRVWLFRLGANDKAIATKFNQQLLSHIAGLGTSVGVPSITAKRQTNLPQPLVCPRGDGWPKTDIGLHSVNDSYNAMLITFSYHEGRFYHIPHLQLSIFRKLYSDVEIAWKSVACSCFQSAASCCGVGCFNCFQLSCPLCDGTGWKDFVLWSNSGSLVDYSSGVPIARVRCRN